MRMRRWTHHPGRSRLCLSQPHDLDDPQQGLLLQRQLVHRNRHATLSALYTDQSPNSSPPAPAPQTFLTQPRPRAPPACQAHPRLKLDNLISLAARVTSSSAPSSTPAGRRTNRARSRVSALLLNLIALCGRAHRRHGQQQLHRPSALCADPFLLECILLHLLGPFLPSLVPGRLLLIVGPVLAQLNNSISLAAPATTCRNVKLGAVLHPSWSTDE